MTRMDIIRQHVFPLVKDIDLEGLTSDFGDAVDLQFRLIEGTTRFRVDSLKKNLARCVRIWPHSKDCGIDKTVLKKAVDVIRDYYH